MLIRFAAARPAGDYALVLPVAGLARAALDGLGAARKGLDAALQRQRFEGEAGAAAEHFVDGDGGRRLLVIGTGMDAAPGDVAEKLGGTLTTRLLLSGEANAVLDLTGLSYDADAAARVALAAELRAWR